MLKLWLVTFSNGEEWHIFGERDDVIRRSCAYAVAGGENTAPTITFVRAYRS